METYESFHPCLLQSTHRVYLRRISISFHRLFEGEKTMRGIHSSLMLSALCLLLLFSGLFVSAFAQTLQLIDPLAIPQFVNQLDQAPAVYMPTNVTDSGGKLVRQDYVVTVSEFTQQILPTVNAEGAATGYPPTKVWGYGGNAHNAVTGEN